MAVLTHLSERNEVAPRQWFLETGFGRLDGTSHPIFPDLEAAQQWMAQRLARSNSSRNLAPLAEWPEGIGGPEASWVRLVPRMCWIAYEQWVARYDAAEEMLDAQCVILSGKVREGRDS